MARFGKKRGRKRSARGSVRSLTSRLPPQTSPFFGLAQKTTHLGVQTSQQGSPLRSSSKLLVRHEKLNDFPFSERRGRRSSEIEGFEPEERGCGREDAERLILSEDKGERESHSDGRGGEEKGRERKRRTNDHDDVLRPVG